MDRNILANIRDIAFITAIYLFFGGWVYDYFYLDTFGISQSQLDISYTSFLIFSFNVFRHNIVLSIIMGLLLVYAFSGKSNLAKYAIIVGLFPVLFYLACDTGIKIAKKQCDGSGMLSPVMLCFSADFLMQKDTLSSEIQKAQLQYFLKENDSDQLYLLAETKDIVYVLYPPQLIQQKDADSYSDFLVYSINKKYIKYYVTSHRYKT